MTTTATLRGNGQVERINAVVKNTMIKLALENPTKWYQHTSRLQRCINATVSRSTKATPFQLMFGVPMKNPEDNDLIKVLEEELIQNFIDKRSTERAQAAGNIAKIQAKNV